MTLLVAAAFLAAWPAIDFFVQPTRSTVKHASTKDVLKRQQARAAIFHFQTTKSIPEPTAKTSPAKRPDVIWIPGDYCGDDWTWNEGFWIDREYLDAEWIPGHWARRKSGLIWIDGYWN